MIRVWPQRPGCSQHCRKSKTTLYFVVFISEEEEGYPSPPLPCAGSLLPVHHHAQSHWAAPPAPLGPCAGTGSTEKKKGSTSCSLFALTQKPSPAPNSAVQAGLDFSAASGDFQGILGNIQENFWRIKLLLLAQQDEALHFWSLVPPCTQLTQVKEGSRCNFSCSCLRRTTSALHHQA